MNSLVLQTEVATPPIVIHGLTTVWPPVTTVPASSAMSYNWHIITTNLQYAQLWSTHAQFGILVW